MWQAEGSSSATALATGLALDLERVVIPGSLLDSLHLPQVPGGMWVGVFTSVLTVALIASVEGTVNLAS
jgi:carbonic anhydrase